MQLTSGAAGNARQGQIDEAKAAGMDEGGYSTLRFRALHAPR
jgi:hypothetical protein